MLNYAPGSTSVSEDIQIVDDSGLPVTGLVAATFPTLTYSRAGANADVAFPALSDLAAITTAWAAGGVKERGNGVYRLDLPDGIFTSAGVVKVRGEATGKHVLVPWIQVAYLGVNAAQLGGQTTQLDVNNLLKVDVEDWKAAAAPAMTGDAYARIGANGAGLTALATAAQINSLAVNTRANLNVPVEIETPDAGTQVYKIRLHLFDVEGNMEAPDSTPTVTLTNAAGTDRSGRLSAAGNPSAGVYTWDYTATAGDAEEQLVWVFTVVEGGLTRTYPATSYVVEQTAYRFSSSDRATLNAAATAAALTTLSNKVGTPATTVAADIAAVKADTAGTKAKTDQLVFTNANKVDATAITVSDKAGYALAAAGLDAIAVTPPTVPATTFPGMVVQLWRRFFKKSTLTNSQLKTFADDGTTVVTTQALSDDGTTQTQGAAA